MNTSIACIALRKNKVLVALRNPVGVMGDRWEFPGGKVEDNESEIQACEREFFEEFGEKITVLEKITENQFSNNDKTRFLKAYHINLKNSGLFKKYKLTEHQKYKWVTFSQLRKLKFVDSDLLILDDVEKFAKNQAK